MRRKRRINTKGGGDKRPLLTTYFLSSFNLCCVGVDCEAREREQWRGGGERGISLHTWRFLCLFVCLLID